MAEAKKKSFIGKVWESIVNTAVLWPRALLATTTCAGQLLRNFLATDVNGGQSLKYKDSVKNRGKKLTYALSAPVTAFSPKLKQKRGKLDKVPGPKERNKDMVRYDYTWRTIGRGAKYEAQIGLDAWLLGSEWIESMLYLDKESPMYVGPWPTIKQKGKNLLKSFVMPLEPLYRRSQNKLWFFGGKKKAKEKEEKKPETKKEIAKPEVKKEEKKPESKPEISAPKKEIASSEKPKTMDELKQQHKLESEKKSVEETKRTLGDWKTMDEKFKKEYIKDYENVFGWTVTEESILERGKKNKKWENMEQLLITLKKENPVMAGFIEDEILAKKGPAAKAA